MDGIAHLGHFREHHGGARAHQKIRAIAQGGIGSQARKGVRTAALHPHHQLAGRDRLALPLVQHFQAGFHPFHDDGDIGAEAFMVLHPHGVTPTLGEPFGHQLLAAQANHQHFAAEIGIARQALQGADRHHRLRRVDGHAAAIGMGQHHDVIYVGIFGQQLGLDALQGIFHRAGHALHRGGNGQDVLGSHSAVGVAVAFKGIAG